MLKSTLLIILSAASAVLALPTGDPHCNAAKDEIAMEVGMQPNTMGFQTPVQFAANVQSYSPGSGGSITFTMSGGPVMYTGLSLYVTDSAMAGPMPGTPFKVGTWTVPPKEANGNVLQLNKACDANCAKPGACGLTHTLTQPGMGYMTTKTFTYTPDNMSTGTLSLSAIVVYKCNITNVFMYQYFDKIVTIPAKQGTGGQVQTPGCCGATAVIPKTCPLPVTSTVPTTITNTVMSTVTCTTPTITSTKTVTNTVVMKQLQVRKCISRTTLTTVTPTTTMGKQGTKATTTACCVGEIGTGTQPTPPAKQGTGGGSNAYGYSNNGASAPAYGNTGTGATYGAAPMPAGYGATGTGSGAVAGSVPVGMGGGHF